MRNSLLLPIATVVMAIVGVSHSVQAESEACMIPLIPSSAAGFASGPLERIIRESYLRPCGSVLTSAGRLIFYNANIVRSLAARYRRWRDERGGVFDLFGQYWLDVELIDGKIINFPFNAFQDNFILGPLGEESQKSLYFFLSRQSNTGTGVQGYTFEIWKAELESEATKRRSESLTKLFEMEMASLVANAPSFVYAVKKLPSDGTGDITLEFTKFVSVRAKRGGLAVSKDKTNSFCLRISASGISRIPGNECHLD